MTRRIQKGKVDQVRRITKLRTTPGRRERLERLAREKSQALQQAGYRVAQVFVLQPDCDIAIDVWDYDGLWREKFFVGAQPDPCCEGTYELWRLKWVLPRVN